MSCFRLLFLTSLACLWCMVLLNIRQEISGQGWFGFMGWNLFLAGIPLGLSLSLQRIRHPLLGMPLIATWLLFFPNAPYVLTDLVHLKQRAGVPLWYDLLLLMSFALVALWMGFQSLRIVQDWVAQRTSALIAWGFVLTSLVLSGFGIYLGRFLRWNSWDIVSRPHALFRDVLVRVTDPLAYTSTWLVTLGFGGLLIIAYLFWVAANTAPATAKVRE